MRKWSVESIAKALLDLDLVTVLFDSKPFFMVHYNRVKQLMTYLEKQEYGVVFGVFLHFL